MLRVEHISKSYSGVQVLHDVSLTVAAGKVHVLCGENGAGKTTLMNIITGNVQSEGGTIYWKGEPVMIGDVRDARSKGIAIVYQERSLVDSLSVAENVFAGNTPQTSWGVIDYARLHEQTNDLLNQLKMAGITAKTLVASLSSAQKQLVEIAKAIAADPQLLILDEPTASLTHTETTILFDLIRQLKSKNVAIIYITHRMQEIQLVGDEVSVLKDGKYMGTRQVSQTTTAELVRMMVGRELQNTTFTSHSKGVIKLKVQNLSGVRFQNIDFDLFEGEVLGVAGLEGSGRTALARTIFGDLPVKSGYIKNMKGEVLAFRHPADAVNERFAYLPDDRKSSGVFLENTIAENIVVTQLKKGIYSEKNNEVKARSVQSRLQIKTAGPKQLAKSLSGGNQQKLVFGKWLNTDPDIFILNEPTHGVDAGAKEEIYSIIATLTAEGKSVILVSSDLPELLYLSDRIAVMYSGELRGVLQKNEATEEKITAMASGIKM